MGITEDNAGSHGDQAVDPEQAAFEHFFVDQDRAASLGSEHDRNRREICWKGRPGTIIDFRNMTRFMPIFFEFFALALRTKTIQQLFNRYFRRYMAILTPIIQEGIDQGEFRRMDPQDAAITLGAIFEGTFLLMVYDPERVELEKHMRFGCDLFLQIQETGECPDPGNSDLSHPKNLEKAYVAWPNSLMLLTDGLDLLLLQCQPDVLPIPRLPYPYIVHPLHYQNST